MKKTIYDTPEMEIEALRKELQDLKSEHSRQAMFLSKNAISMSIKEITIAKDRLDKLRKQKQSIVKKIDKLQPSLFQED